MEIKSYIKLGDDYKNINDCIEISEFNGKFKQPPRYIHGAIVISCDDGREIIGLENWDDIDDLWSYICNGLVLLIKGANYFKTSFPSTPIDLIFEVINNGRDIKIKFVDSKNKLKACVVSKEDFFMSFVEAALFFWRKIAEIDSYFEKDYQYYKQAIGKSR